MSITPPPTQRHRHRPRERTPSPVDDVSLTTFDAAPYTPSRSGTSTTVVIAPDETSDNDDRAELVRMVGQKNRRTEWAKLIAPVNEDDMGRQTKPKRAPLKKFFSAMTTPAGLLLDLIEHHQGYTIRSYFQYVLWLFYLNVFIFILCFTAIILPTYIYPNSLDFSRYAMNQYYEINNISFVNLTAEQCSLTDPQCTAVNVPLYDEVNRRNETCLDDTFTASSCCSLHNNAFLTNSSSLEKNDWRRYLTDLIDGTGTFGANRLFLGYYQNITFPAGSRSYVLKYNMGLAVFLTIFACLLLTGIAILRKYGDSMKTSYVQDESLENDLFKYVFARWDYCISKSSVAARHNQRFVTEMTSILFERQRKKRFERNQRLQKFGFRVQRLASWLLTLFLFGGAAAALYYANLLTFQESAKKELNDGSSQLNRLQDLAIEYLPSLTVSLINLLAQIIFAYMRDWNLYRRSTEVRHYLIRVIVMRLFLLTTFVLIIILQISCNSNQCGQQSRLIDCVSVRRRATFIHCWETLMGQAIYRLVITDTLVMLVIHLIVDPIQRILIACCCCSKRARDDSTVNGIRVESKPCFLLRPPQFEVENYVLDLTYTQTLCWYGLLFCPFLPAIAALKNLLIFAVKWLSVSAFRRRSDLELSPARSRYLFTAVLLFSFVWASLPVTFFVTSLRPSRGCGPFRLHSDDSEYYMYYSVRNLLSQIPYKVVIKIFFQLSSAIVLTPIVLILILFSCALTIRRNSYRAVSMELRKLVTSSRDTHRLALRLAPAVSDRF